DDEFDLIVPHIGEHMDRLFSIHGNMFKDHMTSKRFAKIAKYLTKEQVLTLVCVKETIPWFKEYLVDMIMKDRDGDENMFKAFENEVEMFAGMKRKSVE